MPMDEAKEPIKIYLDDQEEPFKTDYPPLRFSFSTIHLADGPHRLRVEASNGLAPPTIKEIPFNVRNGVAVTVSGLNPNQTIGGQVELIINAYAGNTEVDFEPRRAETPQPIPTWAWVLLLGVIAWTLFYVLNPATPEREAVATVEDMSPVVGERLYMDTCARCHADDGTGRRDPDVPQNYLVKKLRDTPNLAIAESPFSLLFKVVTGVRTTGIPDKPVRMPAWGPRFTNEEIVAVVNYVRSAWGHDASQIRPRYRRPPAGIDELEEDLLDAMTKKDAATMEGCCWPDGIRPQLYRVDGPRWAIGREDVVGEWRGYFEALGSGEILDFQLTDVRYDYEPETVDTIGSRVFAMGRIFLSTRTFTGSLESETGRFIRVYQRVEEPAPLDPRADPDARIRIPEWALIFDFASIPMRVGCVPGVEPECPPGEQPGPVTPLATAEGIGYAEIQDFFRALGRDVGDAPHERFWELPHKEFIALEFPVSWDEVEDVVPLLVVGDSKASNMIRALRDGKAIQVRTARGKVITKNIQKMPKGASMPDETIARIAAWIDAGCPEFPLDKSQLPTVGGNGGAPRDVVPSDQAIGFEDVRRLFRALKRQVGDAPHEVFWELPYEEFVQLEFPYSWDDVDETVKLLEPWNAAESNMIKALKGGRGIQVTKGGRTTRRTIALMPKGGQPMAPEDVARIAAWIDAGCPREPGGPSPWPKPGAAPVPGDGGGAPKEPARPEAPADEPKRPPAPPPPVPDEREASATASVPLPPQPEAPPPVIGFSEVQEIFKALRQKAPQAPHSNFWKELPYEEFVAFEFPEGPGKDGQVRLLVPWDSDASNMIKALTDGKGLEIRYPDGRVVTRDIAPMPKDADPMPPADVARLRAWIDAGCPEFVGQPSALPR